MTLRPVLTLLLLAFAGTTYAANPLCQQKEQAIQQQIEYAKQHDNARRITGLERALSEVRGHCTDAELKAAHASKVAEHQEKVSEREADLREAQASGDSKKIAKREKKLAEAREELATLKAQPY
ncbi:DUF1090 domain-containing protein [Pantoea sp. 1.19]|uniref:DUF1090 domain-containing protein n=1 Tax=Pantoea sp. 1.19 TaxID=1925589 RepID=UPI000948C353|nr:DUF1090 domain-containing protein [Pantoea sp. 1.19]